MLTEPSAPTNTCHRTHGFNNRAAEALDNGHGFEPLKRDPGREQIRERQTGIGARSGAALRGLARRCGQRLGPQSFNCSNLPRLGTGLEALQRQTGEPLPDGATRTIRPFHVTPGTNHMNGP